MDHLLEIQSIPSIQSLVNGNVHDVFPENPKEIQIHNQSGKYAYKMAYLVQKILERCTGTEDLATHLVFIDSLDEQSKRAISSTIFMNKLAVSLCHILLLYGGTIPSPFRGGFQYFHHGGFPDLLKPALETCLDNPDPSLSKMGKDIIQIFRNYDRYWKLQLSSLFPDIGGSCHRQFPINCNMVFQRHSTSDGIFCITVRSDLTQSPNILWSTCSHQDVEGDIELLHCNEDLLVWIPSHSGPFTAAGHFPVLAGQTSHGQNAYIACLVHNPDGYAYSPHYKSSFYTATVIEGESFARLWHEGNPWGYESYYVLALRHDPSDILPGSFPVAHEGDQDQTGPFYWSKVNVDAGL